MRPYGARPRPRRQARRLYELILIVTFLMLLYISEQVAIVSLERDIFDTVTAAEDAARDVERLRIEASNLKKSSRIKRIAMEDLGMRVPEGLPEILF
jgi:cell division protein FtsL